MRASIIVMFTLIEGCVHGRSGACERLNLLNLLRFCLRYFDSSRIESTNEGISLVSKLSKLDWQVPKPLRYHKSIDTRGFKT